MLRSLKTKKSVITENSQEKKEAANIGNENIKEKHPKKIAKSIRSFSRPKKKLRKSKGSMKISDKLSNEDLLKNEHNNTEMNSDKQNSESQPSLGHPNNKYYGQVDPFTEFLQKRVENNFFPDRGYNKFQYESINNISNQKQHLYVPNFCKPMAINVLNRNLALSSQNKNYYCSANEFATNISPYIPGNAGKENLFTFDAFKSYIVSLLNKIEILNNTVAKLRCESNHYRPPSESCIQSNCCNHVDTEYHCSSTAHLQGSSQDIEIHNNQGSKYRHSNVRPCSSCINDPYINCRNAVSNRYTESTVCRCFRN